MMNDMTFAQPEFFWALLLLPALAAYYIFNRKRQYSNVRFSSLQGFSAVKPSLRQRMRHVLIILRLCGLALLITALARPQSSSDGQNITTEGIDIVLAIDISGSMRAEDFRPNRIEAAKNVAVDFIDDRPNDRVGLVIFAGESFTQCPLTTDHDVLKNLFQDVKSGMIEDGTAIGMGLATAVNRLKESKAKSKVVILLTDGVNNSGFVAPVTAAEIAETYGIRVYTIGVGTKGVAPYPMQDRFGRTVYQNVEVQIDEKTLEEIADQTGGKYFRATNNKALAGIYDEIDQLEKTKIEVTEFRRYSEEFLPFAIAAALLLAFELLLRYTAFRSLP